MNEIFLKFFHETLFKVCKHREKNIEKINEKKIIVCISHDSDGVVDI